MKRTFERQLDSLHSIVAFIDEFAETGLSQNHIPAVQLVVEEIFTNMVRHNPDGGDDISLELELSGSKITITLIDSDSPRFDIGAQKPVDISAPLKDRKPGGLGIHLVKHMVDEILYRYKDGESVITLIKRLD